MVGAFAPGTRKNMCVVAVFLERVKKQSWGQGAPTFGCCWAKVRAYVKSTGRNAVQLLKLSTMG